jgi:hypothetical protein
MSKSEAQRSPLGALRLSVPDGYRAHWLSDPRDREKVEHWTAASPDGSLYNTPAYIAFAREQNGRADLLWLAREGNPVLGLPIHPLAGPRITTGYAGAMFPGGPKETPLRRGVAALVALLAANRRLGFELLQSAQAPAYDDPARLTNLALLFARHRLGGPSLYSRVLDIEPHGEGSTAQPDLSAELLLDNGLSPYRTELRNQIRQAIRNGLHATCSLPSSGVEAHAAYSEFTLLHRESWTRTGMTPHRQDYWTGLSRAILDGGGRDMVVCTRDGDGTALAAVICHLRDDRALYWAGASSERGLSLRANPLCLHAAIQACRQLGTEHFELGRFDARESSPKELTVTRYKAQFGGALVRIVGFRTRPAKGTVLLSRALDLLRRPLRRTSERA